MRLEPASRRGWRLALLATFVLLAVIPSVVAIVAESGFHVPTLLAVGGLALTCAMVAVAVQPTQRPRAIVALALVAAAADVAALAAAWAMPGAGLVRTLAVGDLVVTAPLAVGFAVDGFRSRLPRARALGAREIRPSRS